MYNQYIPINYTFPMKRLQQGGTWNTAYDDARFHFDKGYSTEYGSQNIS